MEKSFKTAFKKIKALTVVAKESGRSFGVVGTIRGRDGDGATAPGTRDTAGALPLPVTQAWIPEASAGAPLIGNLFDP